MHSYNIGTKYKLISAERCGIELNNPNKRENLLLNSLENDRRDNFQEIKTCFT